MGNTSSAVDLGRINDLDAPIYAIRSTVLLLKAKDLSIEAFKEYSPAIDVQIHAIEKLKHKWHGTAHEVARGALMYAHGVQNWCALGATGTPCSAGAPPVGSPLKPVYDELRGTEIYFTDMYQRAASHEEATVLGQVEGRMREACELVRDLISNCGCAGTICAELTPCAVEQLTKEVCVAMGQCACTDTTTTTTTTTTTGGGAGVVQETTTTETIPSAVIVGEVVRDSCGNVIMTEHLGKEVVSTNCTRVTSPGGHVTEKCSRTVAAEP